MEVNPPEKENYPGGRWALQNNRPVRFQDSDGVHRTPEFGEASAPLQIRQTGGISYNEARRYWVLTIRLARVGKKKSPSYRVVVIDKRRPRNGRFVEIVGTYNPLKKPAEIKLDAERIQYWLGCGAQPSDTVRSFLRHQKKA
jgi:small subunit ribosomal protein S16